jgi:hypothetical protein
MLLGMGRDWVDPVESVRHELFANGVASGKSLRRAAVDAGFPAGGRIGEKLLKSDAVRGEIQRVLELARSDAVLESKEILSLWSLAALGEIEMSASQMKASENLAKALGLFGDGISSGEVVIVLERK